MPPMSWLHDLLPRIPSTTLGVGKVASLAAPTADDIGFCMSHMRMWLKLADAELRCEFPDFEVAQAEQIQFRYMC